MNVSYERAYQEACLALGQAIVENRLLVAESLEPASRGVEVPDDVLAAADHPIVPEG